jgi:hypothetical protein
LAALGVSAAVPGCCRLPRPVGSDAIHLCGDHGQPATIILDRKPAVCDQDDVLTATTSVVDVGHIGAPQCAASAAVLVRDKGMYFTGNVRDWTDHDGDVMNIRLSSMPRLPTSIWVPPDDGEWSARNDAVTELAAAKSIYNDMQCGIDFDAEIKTSSALKNLTIGCNDLTPLGQVGLKPIAGRLNIYYVEQISDPAYNEIIGQRCATNGNVILISLREGLVATLAHEVGHALSLGDAVSGLAGSTANGVSNLMLQASSEQKLLSIGQCFRVNLNPTSAINVLGARRGETPGCRDTAGSAACPPLSFDIPRK